MPYFIKNLLEYFAIYDHNEQIMLFSITIAWIIILFLRIYLAIRYKAQISILKYIRPKDDVDKIKSAYYKRAAKDYVTLGECGIARINSRELAEKSAQKFSIFFWNYKSIETFITTLESSFLFIGILLTVLSENRLAFAVVAMIIFVSVKLCATFFDFETAKDQLFTETAFMLDREFGKLFMTDVPAAINNLKTELRQVLTIQSKLLTETINDMRDKLAAVSERTLGDTAAAIESALSSVSASAETVQKPLESWKNVIIEARDVNKAFNVSIESMSNVSESFKSSIVNMESLIGNYKNQLLENNKIIEHELLKLNQISALMAGASEKAVSQTSAIETSLQYIETNQNLLESSINQYEIALKDIATSVGEGLAKIIGYQLQNSYSAIADDVADSIKMSNNANNEFMLRLQSLFDRILEQSKNETSLIMSLKEQMELQIEELKRSIG